MTSAPLAAARYDHTGFVSLDVDASAAFWSGALGLAATEPVERGAPWVAGMTGVPGARLRIVHLTGPGIHLEFIGFLSPAGGRAAPAPTDLATGHVCLRVPDPGAALAAMLAMGATPEGQLARIADGALAGRHGVYLRDPGGVLIELLEDPGLSQTTPL